MLFLNGSGTTLATMAPLIDVLARRLEVVAHDQRGLGRSAIPVGPYTMARVRRRCARAPRRGGVADVSRGRGELRWHGGPGAGRHRPDARRAPGPGVHVAGGRRGRVVSRCTSWPGLAPRRRAEISRQLLDSRFTDEWLASHPRDRMLVEARAQRAAAVSDEARRGEVEQLEARRHHDVWDAARAHHVPDLRRRRVASTASPRVANSEAIVSRVPGATLQVYDGGHAFFAQDRRALPEIIDFLAS